MSTQNKVKLADDILLIRGDARRLPLPDESVQCIVTSPPYWGLRKYAGAQDLLWGEERCPVAGIDGFRHEWAAAAAAAAKTGGLNSSFGYTSNQFVTGHHADQCVRCDAWRGSFGLEPTIEMYVAHTVEILRECRRVLRPDGVLFWNIGDSYCAGATSARSYENLATSTARDARYGKEARMPANWRNDANKIARNGRPDGLKPKDLCLIPARVALAAQSDGWWVRSVIIWAKPNPMPESVTDRPTDAYEHILMLTKSARYFWDAHAVREPSESGPSDVKKQIEKKPRIGGKTLTADDPLYKANMETHIGQMRAVGEPGSRNLRNVWTFPTQPYKGSHFATFPEELPRRCILAATSERGACRQCGAPWERVTRNGELVADDGGPTRVPVTPVKRAELDGWSRPGGRVETVVPNHHIEEQTIGWRPTCLCKGQRGRTAPCVVLDPFGGSGTTGRVAASLNRRAVSMDLAYHTLSEKRTRHVQRRLPAL
jgi:DNA modification methylase